MLTMLMAIGRNKRLLNRQYIDVLPVSWNTLYELARLTDEEFDSAVEAGKSEPWFVLPHGQFEAMVENDLPFGP